MRSEQGLKRKGPGRQPKGPFDEVIGVPCRINQHNFIIHCRRTFRYSRLLVTAHRLAPDARGFAWQLLEGLPTPSFGASLLPFRLFRASRSTAWSAGHRSARSCCR